MLLQVIPWERGLLTLARGTGGEISAAWHYPVWLRAVSHVAYRVTTELPNCDTESGMLLCLQPYACDAAGS